MGVNSKVIELSYSFLFFFPFLYVFHCYFSVLIDISLFFHSAYMDVGDMNTVCQKCNAIVWVRERSHSDSTTLSRDVSMCCMKGKITLPYMIEPPPFLRQLFNGLHLRSVHFLANIRSYNNLFSFTSMGGKIETRINHGQGPPHFVISGQNYHRIGCLLPSDGERPKFCQFYIYDTENELANRMAHFRLGLQIIILACL